MVSTEALSSLILHKLLFVHTNCVTSFSASNCPLPSLTLLGKSKDVAVIKQVIAACLFRHAVFVEMPTYSDILLSLLLTKNALPLEIPFRRHLCLETGSAGMFPISCLCLRCVLQWF